LNFIEKRIFRRLNADLPVDLEISGKVLQANSGNISCGGMYLHIDPETLDSKEEVKITIHLPNQKKPVKVVGQICRSESRGVAVEFQGLYNDNILAIEKFVKARLN